MAYLITFVLLLGVVLIVTSPLRRPHAPDGEDGAESGAESAAHSGMRIDLEAARDAKYREIRDAELDHQTGKLSDSDYEAIDSSLRAEAIELLRKLDALAAAGGERTDATGGERTDATGGERGDATGGGPGDATLDEGERSAE